MKRENQQYRRENPGPLRQWFGSLWSNTTGGIVAWFTLFKTLPQFVLLGCGLLCILMAAMILRSFQRNA